MAPFDDVIPRIPGAVPTQNELDAATSRARPMRACAPASPLREVARLELYLRPVRRALGGAAPGVGVRRERAGVRELLVGDDALERREPVAGGRRTPIGDAGGAGAPAPPPPRPGPPPPGGQPPPGGGGPR